MSRQTSSNEWTSGEIDDRLDNLFEGLDEALSGTPAKQAYQDAAAVLASFDPERLKPLSTEVARGESVHSLLGPSSLASVSTETDWVLTSEARRESLQRLVQEDRVEEALSANPGRRQDLLQKTLERYLRVRRATGSPPAPLFDTLPGDASVPELQATLQVAEWLSGILPVPDLESLRHRVERENFLRPFRDLVGERFAGREQQLAELSDYVGIFAASGFRESAARTFERIFSIRERPPLMIQGPGGIGKSTLIAQFILINSAAQYVQRFPYAYLDFDRPGLFAEEPVTLLSDAIHQIGLQFPEHRERALRLRQEWQRKARGSGASQRVSTEHSRFVRFSQPEWFYDSFASFIAELTPAASPPVPPAPLLLVLDTFEEVQYRSATFVTGIFDFLEQMQRRIPQLRTVLSGRADVQAEDYSVRPLKLPPFDRDAAQAFLEKQGVKNVGLGFAIADQVGGSPLVLKMAAKLVTLDASEAGPDGIQDLETGLLARVMGKSIEGQLYHRILDHIHDEDVRKLAHPGLILRRITEDLIKQVLAGECGVDARQPGRARALFEKLAAEIALVETGEPGVLVHRPDVRALTLRMLIEDKAQRRTAEAINENAIRYYADRSGSEARAEELYHLLLFGLDRTRVEPRANDPLALRLIKGSVEELPEKSQAFLAARIGIERPARVWKAADLADWELYAARIARENLAMGRAEPALSLIRQRRERTVASPLLALEIEALYRAGADGKDLEAKIVEVLRRPDIVSSAVWKQLRQLPEDIPFVRALMQETAMVACWPPNQVVHYRDPDEHHGRWVSTRGTHELKLPGNFYLSPTLVTNALFLQFVHGSGYQKEEFWNIPARLRQAFTTADGKTLGPGNWPSADRFPEGQANHPVSSISYQEACAFVQWFGASAKRSGWDWSLPPEDCWEWAARGAAGFAYPWGNEFDAAKCNCQESGFGGTTEVEAYGPGRSPAGLLDMAGNVWEFVESSDSEDGLAILRGGSFDNTGEQVRSYLRLFGVPRDHRPPDFGFRLAWVPVSNTMLSKPPPVKKKALAKKRAAAKKKKKKKKK